MKNRDIKFEIIWEDLQEKTQKQIVTLDNLLLGAWELPSNRLRMIAKRQFTGLLDKHGKEIYESDIVKNPEFIAQVIWFVDGYVFDKYDTSGKYLSLCHYGTMEIEKLGNIWENPDLLKTEQQEGSE